MSKYCRKCGKKLNEEENFCSKCGQEVEENISTSENTSTYNNQSKSKIGAGLLGIFLGYLGIHNFYLGYTNKGIAQLLLTLVGWIACGLGPIAAGIWGLIEGILILTGNINEDADGNPIRD